jgi:hypothetical protein
MQHNKNTEQYFIPITDQLIPTNPPMNFSTFNPIRPALFPQDYP